MRFSIVCALLIAVTAVAAAAAAAPRVGPLPSLQLDRAIDTGRAVDAAGSPDIPPAREVSPATARAIAVLLQEAGPVARPVLKVQVLGPEAGDTDDPILHAAAQSLAHGEWAQAEKSLKDYLGIPRTPDLAARARFYLGLAYWFQDRPRDAFFEFLMCEDELPRQSRAWQEDCLTALTARD